MLALQRKLFRDLWLIRSQVFAIAMVIAAGVGVCIMSLSTWKALELTKDTYYREYRFADVFASLKRAPLGEMQRIRAIDGVRAAQGRVISGANLHIPGFAEPITGLLSSLPQAHELNQLVLRRGRYPDPARSEEVLLSDALADAHRLNPGDQLAAVINGRYRTLRITGIALSPEHVYQIAPGAILPDFKRFGILWMPRRSLERARDMDGAFNDLVVQLSRDADQARVIREIDRLLMPYGGRGAYGREDQLSERFLREEFGQLKTMAYLFPLIFMAVAVFLLNVVIQRLVATQRENIAALKAFGYHDREIFRHYAELVAVIASIGILLGIALGTWLGKGLSNIYMEYYRFPFLLFSLPLDVLLLVCPLALLAALGGSWRAVKGAADLPPAQAMRGELPVDYKASWLEKVGVTRRLRPDTRMVVRYLERQPRRALIAIAGLSLATAIMMVGSFQMDAANFMVHVHFDVTQREDVQLGFTEPVAQKALGSLRNIEGVRYLEGYRSVPVRLRNRQFHERINIQGLQTDAQLQKVLDIEFRELRLPPAGLLLSERLAQNLRVRVGDLLQVEVLEQGQQKVQIPVAAITQQFFGMSAYMNVDALNRVMQEGRTFSGALLQLEPGTEEGVYRELLDMPRVAGIGVRQAMLNSFNDILERSLLTFTFINTILGGVIATGVVYNTARIAFSERARELASLRVLGYRQGEVAYVLLAELGILTLLAIPIGFVIGHHLCAFLASQLQSDLFRVPLVLESRTYAMSALVIVVSSLLSGWYLWEKVRGLDLVEVLKTRE
ncbi:ABC transporter permease [Biformimicrobium ophioploci]|uniref:ABC transporter permease n=1 Tax=Biformimicrobium ophioploci TaxID=3036711 RepID=A0ABQ6LXX2_9GAMM|nr:ABC transporter permease [Microbulbifer sp. NKW57]GMG86918.1 ABC transporter permease [Microbulbifer sp. NKW57]